MTDIVDKSTRSRMMSGIRGKDTQPELAIRRGLHKRGFRYKLRNQDIPGRPDLVFPKFNALVLVNGCFWHGHDCHLFKWPDGGRADFWRKKITGNMERDARLLRDYAEKGRRVAVVWECCLKGKSRLSHDDVIDQLVEWLKGDVEFLDLRGE
jgi:DNA mismatch endonuclease, patch repair protein